VCERENEPERESVRESESESKRSRGTLTLFDTPPRDEEDDEELENDEL
jgi:hypothetical protein